MKTPANELKSVNEFLERCCGQHLASRFYASVKNFKLPEAIILSDVLEAVHAQGQKDAFEEIQSAIDASRGQNRSLKGGKTSKPR